MARIRLEKYCYLGRDNSGNEISSHNEIVCSHEPSGICGTISASYISAEKIAEFKENGFAYVNQPIERIV